MVKRNIIRSRSDSADKIALVFEFRRLCCDKSENDFFSVRNACERLESARTLIIEFEIECVNVFSCKESLRNCVISSAACVGGVEVSAADVGCYREIIGFALARLFMRRSCSLIFSSPASSVPKNSFARESTSIPHEQSSNWRSRQPAS